MAILVDRYTVVVRNVALDQRYPGGRKGFVRSCPYSCDSDPWLTWAKFYDARQATEFAALLTRHGLVPTRRGKALDAVVIDSYGLTSHPCPWLEMAHYEGTLFAWALGNKPNFIAEAEAQQDMVWVCLVVALFVLLAWFGHM